MRWYEDMLEDEGVRPVDMRRKIPLINNPRDKNSVENDEIRTYESLCRQVSVVRFHYCVFNFYIFYVKNT